MHKPFPIASWLLILNAASACGSAAEDERMVVSFDVHVDGAPVGCETSYANLGTTERSAELADAKMYVSELELRTEAGDWVAVALEQDSPWQHENVALLDFEDGTGACAESGTSEVNTEVRFVVPKGDYRRLRFRVGVPFELNHTDGATAAAPLNVPGMFWTWQSGYKFLRLDWVVAGDPVQRWNDHIGAVGCTSEAATRSPDEPCSRPNFARIGVHDFRPNQDVVSLDLSKLVEGVDLSHNTVDTPPGCLSDPNEPEDCAPLFTALGLDFAEGRCHEDCSGQTAFQRGGS